MNPEIDKLEPAPALNHEARSRFMDEIGKRMNAMNQTILNKTKYALDKCEFARNHSLDQPMDRSIQFLKEAQIQLRASIEDHKYDLEAMDRLIDTGTKIKKGEGDK